MEPIPNEVDEPRQRNSDQGTRGGTNRVLVFCPSEKLVLLWDYADVGCKSARYERHEKLFASKNSLKCSTANKFRKQRLSLILDQKVLTIAAPKSLLCAVASERRRAKWKVKSESVGCGSDWKRLTGRTRIACSN